MRGVLNLMALVRAANCNQQLKGIFPFWQKKIPLKIAIFIFNYFCYDDANMI
jgi:hypothetical protein